MMSWLQGRCAPTAVTSDLVALVEIVKGQVTQPGRRRSGAPWLHDAAVWVRERGSAAATTDRDESCPGRTA
jgi:hypothetical protein